MYRPIAFILHRLLIPKVDRLMTSYMVTYNGTTN